LTYREIPPAPALRRHVECYWQRTGDDDCAPADVPHRVLPDGCMDILVQLTEGGATAGVVGTMTRALRPSGAGRTTFVGVRFHPGEAFAFLDVAADDARDALLTPQDAGRPELDELAHLVASAPVHGRARALDDWLLTRLPRVRAADHRVRRAVALLVASRGTVRIAQVAAAAGVGDRQLERSFAERVGIGPKSLARVLRFQALVAAIDAHASQPIPWAHVAADVGYADQAHMTREVRTLTGVTPTELARERRSDFFKAVEAPMGKMAGLQQP
jgi:AraC-like DNA-binding protein